MLQLHRYHIQRMHADYRESEVIEMKSPASRVDIAGWWYELDQRVKIGLTVGLGVIVIILCIAAILLARTFFPPQGPAEPTLAVTSPPSTVPTEPPPTSTPEPTAPEPTEVPTPEPTQPAFLPDGENDAVVYESGDPVEEAPAGVDIRVASIRNDLSVTLGIPDEVPQGLADLATEGDVLLWLELYKPIPESPEERLEWLFALDMDDDTETGRPAGQRPINPDLGYEVAIGLAYEGSTYSTYVLIWQAGSWVAGPQATYLVDETGTLIGLAVPREELVAQVLELSGVETVPDDVKGRLVALAGTGANRIADFYPDLPE
jgi:hypothetical protein